MKKPIFTGAGVALVTPMNPDMSVNYHQLKKLIEFQLEQGTQAIIVCGTTGESCTLNHDEHCEVIRTAVEQVQKRVPVIAGTGSNDTQYCIKLSQKAQELDVDGLLLITPYYNKTSQRGLVQHYSAVSSSVDVPMILYSVQSRTGVNIEPQTCYELAKLKNVVGLKDAKGDCSQISLIRKLCGDDLPIYSGNDDQILPILSLGGRGVISVLSNILPKETQQICSLYFEGHVEKSMELHLHLLDLMNCLFIDVNPVPVKEAMNMMGLMAGDCRLPLYKMEDKDREKLRNIMKQLNMI